MMRFLRLYYQLARRWLTWYWQARTCYDLHGPAVYRFAEAVLEDDRRFYAFSRIETLRYLLSADKRELPVKDYGAGSLVHNGRERSVANIVKYTPVSRETGRQLFRMVNCYHPDNILELGSSLGISTAYLAAARRQSTVHTIEGSPAIYAQACRNWEWLELKNIRAVNAPFEDALPKLLAKIQSVDLLFLDGDHREEASMRYFEECLIRAHAGSIFVIADIHWSAEMERAWERMKAHASVRLAIDLFDIGVLFFDPGIVVKQDYSLVRSRWKPWRMGFF